MDVDSPRTSLDLPLEIAELVIDQIADKHTLRTMALVCSRYVHSCQKKLFHTIDLGDRCISGEEYYRRLYRFLSQRPNFRPYVRDLRLVDTYVWDSNKDWRWIMGEESICDMLEFLPNLRSFALTINTGQAEWVTFKPSIRNAFVKLAKRPTLVSYSLNHIKSFPPTLLVTLATMKCLELNDVTINDLSSLGVVLGVASISTPLLETLVIKAPTLPSTNVLRSILSLSTTPTLKTLHISNVDIKDPDIVNELWGLMRWAANTITDLEWRPAIRPRAPATCPPPPIDVGILQQLQTLHFLVNFHSKIPRVFADLLVLLAQISSGARFHDLIIECMFMQAAELVACGSDWSSLDSILSQPSFCGLQTVVFCARFRSSAKMKASAKTILSEQLPAVRAKGVRIRFAMDL